jgi:hypothetical protein
MSLKLSDFSEPFQFKCKGSRDFNNIYYYCPDTVTKEFTTGTIELDWKHNGFVKITTSIPMLQCVVAGQILETKMHLSDYEKVEPTKLTPKK